MQSPAPRSPFRVEAIAKAILWSTAILLLAGILAVAAWWHTGNPFWIRAYFYYPGAFFFIGCNLIGGWFAYRCWREFAPGDLLRPAWFLITLSAGSMFVGGLASHVLGHQSHINPLVYLPEGHSAAAIRIAFDVGRVFGPLSMLCLAWGLFYVVRTCRRNGILGSLKAVDYAQLAIVVAFTVHFVSSVVIGGDRPAGPVAVADAIGWASDPLLCVLLLEAILIRRSTANMGWGLISRCWLSFTVAVFLTSMGDIGLWAAARGYLPYALEVSSWYVWFIASAAYALGPAYQLQAMQRATREHSLPAEMDVRQAAGSYLSR